jgi:serine/threonine protein kinase
MDTDEFSRFPLPQEKFLLPERVIVRDPEGDQYAIESVLARGDFGAVYLVRERGVNHKFFALKEIINPDKRERERFTFEGETLKRLRHKALPRVYRTFENDKLKRVYLLMDYIQGENLATLREAQPEKRYTLSSILAIMQPAIEALVYLHSQHPPIVHRDIKPANIIVTTNNDTVLVDFGSAKEYKPGTTTIVTNHRSPGYAAPEQYFKGTSPSTDIYGLGATFYELLTGTVPLDAPTRILRIKSTGTDPLSPAHRLQPAVPLAISQTLQRALALDPVERFTRVEEFWQALTRLDKQQTLPVSTDVPGTSPVEQQAAVAPAEEPKTPPARKYGLLLLCLGLVVLAASGAGFLAHVEHGVVLLSFYLGILLFLAGMFLPLLTLKR